MDEFDFDDLQEQNPKKSNDKKQQNKQPSKKQSFNNNIRNSWNKNNDDFYDLQVQDKPKPKQSKLNNLSDEYLDSETDNNYTKNQKNQKQNKQNESILPKININKSPRNSQQKPTRNKMDLSLQQLPQKKVFVAENSKKNKKKEQQEYDFEVYGTQKESASKSQLKTKISPIKQKMIQVQKPIEKSPPTQKVNSLETNYKSPQNNKLESKKQIEQDEQGDYQQEYEQEIFDEQEVEQKTKTPEKKNNQDLKKQQKNLTQIVDTKIDTKSKQVKNDSKSVKKIEPQTKRGENKTVISQKSKQQNLEQKITKYKQLVQKSFPNDQDEQKVQKLKPDAINRLNQKMREMIKGFSKELTDMIYKNLTLLRKPQNQIKEQIEGQTDPIQAQIKLLEQMKKNNQKVIQNTQKQLQTVNKTNQKISSSAQSNAHMTEQIQAYKKQIAIVSRENSNLKNEIQKQGKKVTKLQQNNKQGLIGQEYKDSKFKSALQITQRLANHKLQFDKNKKKLSQLQQKLSGLEDKIAEISKKRNKIYQKAQNQGISFHTKEQKKRYDQLKKKRDQHQLFESKYNSSIKSKQAVIQYEMSDFQVVIAQYQKRYQLLNEQVEKSKQKIFLQINRAKKNPKIHPNTRQILTQLQLFMSEDNPNKTQQDQNSLNLISKNIYKKQYQSKGHSKTLNDEKSDKKIQYKNYLQQVARKNEQSRKKVTTQRKISQHNPFRKAVTPNQSAQVSLTVQKMNKTKQPQAKQDKQRQRIWKSSNTQVLIRNPLKRQNDKNRYGQIKQEQNPLQNKEIMKLINKNKEKITLKQSHKDKKEQQTSILANKKPFMLRTIAKQQSQQLNQLAGISKQMEKIQKQIQSHRSSLKRENDKENNGKVDKEENVEVKLNIKNQQSLSLQATLELKPASNITPFKNFKLKKDKDKQNNENPSSESTFKLPIQKPIEQKIQKQSFPIKEQIKQSITVSQDPTPFKPKRFNLRKKNQNQTQSYIPSARNIQQNNSINTEQKPQNKKDVYIIVEENKLKKSQPIQFNTKPTQNNQKEQAFDPFKKFMINQKKEQKSISLTQQPNKQPLKLDDNKQTQINLKPRMNLFKKGTQQTQNNSKKLILLGDVKKQQKFNDQKVINPYAQQVGIEKQSQVPKIQRQGRLKKMNPPSNSIKPVNKNIFADVEDATINTNIKLLGDPQPPKKEPELYVPKSINTEKQLNINDLLGIKKKNFQVDKQLLIDLPDNNKLSVKPKAKGKANDFFGDLDL